jgi:hypothetical protein
MGNTTSLFDPRVFGGSSSVAEVIAGALPPGGTDSTGLVSQMQQLLSASQAETQTVQANTSAITENTTQLGQGGGSTVGRPASAVEGALGIGSALSPAVSGLVGLFGSGGGGAQTQAPAAFVLPPSVHADAGVVAASAPAFGVDYAGGGQPRSATTSAVAPQITVQVQAMDSQSFLDHSNDIAMAVRRAMLETSVLNDVIREV